MQSAQPGNQKHKSHNPHHAPLPQKKKRGPGRGPVASGPNSVPNTTQQLIPARVPGPAPEGNRSVLAAGMCRQAPIR